MTPAVERNGRATLAFGIWFASVNGMHTLLPPRTFNATHPPQPTAGLAEEIEAATRLLPEQGPINVFVFENTLLAFEHLPFHEALAHGERLFGHEPYLPESEYRAQLTMGRIRFERLRGILEEEMGGRAGEMLDGLTTRLDLRLAMLQYPLRAGDDSELAWHMAETDSLRKFAGVASAAHRGHLVSETRRWVMRDLRGSAAPAWARRVLAEQGRDFEAWPTERWEELTLRLLYAVCLEGVRGLPGFSQPTAPPVRHRDWLLRAGGPDCDRPVNALLTRFCAAFLDQGLSRWPLPGRDGGFYRAFLRLYALEAGPLELPGLPAEARRLLDAGTGPLESAAESLRLLGVGADERPDFLLRTLLPLRGWASMIRQVEQRGGRVPLPAPAGSLTGFVAVRLLLDRLSLADALPDVMPAAARETLTALARPVPGQGPGARAFVVFQLAKALGWAPPRLAALGRDEWAALVREIEAFGPRERRRVFHIAYERRLRRQVLDALAAHEPASGPETPAFQCVFCLDAREESIRRHIEEACPAAETLGAAGFFGVAMYYKGASDAHYATQCPIVVTPRHWVVEEACPEQERSHRLRAGLRWLWGKASHLFHLAGRTLLPGAVVSAGVGAAAVVPMVSGVLFPRLADRVAGAAARVAGATPTRLRLERGAGRPGPEGDGIGFSVEEMAGIAEGMLRCLGVVGRLSRLMIFLGHGSECLNNPHESAYHCGACSGSPGGPNARALALMLNDPRVRGLLAERGVEVPDSTWFLGGLHNTATDAVTLYDLGLVPATHAGDVARATAVLEEARGRNAHERCRRFHSAPLTITQAEALRHVEARAADLAQTRPEYGNGSNALCVVGRRARTRGLFLDRRAFLQSYDPTTDDAEGSILGGILAAVVPVCKGINLQYYFSAVDSGGWGAGTKLPHNLASLLGVMDGAASDLRTGLPWQGVEVHEPVRLIMAVETTPEVMGRIMARDRAVGQLFENGWVQLALLDPQSRAITSYRGGAFEAYKPAALTLPDAPTSADWYRGWREHLELARIGGTGRA